MFQRATLPSTRRPTRTRRSSVRPWAHLTLALSALFTVATTANGQVVRQTVSGGDDTVTIAEVQAEVGLSDDGSLVVQMVMAADQRSQAYQNVNLSRGDRIVALCIGQGLIGDGLLHCHVATKVDGTVENSLHFFSCLLIGADRYQGCLDTH